MRVLGLFLSSMFVMSSMTLASEKDSWEDCAFKCEAIPPMEQSHVQLRDGERSDPRGKLSNEFSVMVWNIYKGREDNFKEDFAYYRDLHDLVLTQEAVLEGDLDDVLLADSEADFATSFYQTDDSYTGVLNTSNVPVTGAQIFRTSDREPFSKSPKMIMATTYDLENGESLLVLNIHGINFRGKKGLKKQLADTAELLESHEGPIIFAGDFNTKRRSREKLTDKFMERFGMERVIWEGDDRRKPLDHVYYRGLTLKSESLLQDIESSDHPLMLVSFEAE